MQLSHIILLTLAAAVLYCQTDPFGSSTPTNSPSLCAQTLAGHDTHVTERTLCSLASSPARLEGGD